MENKVWMGLALVTVLVIGAIFVSAQADSEEVVEEITYSCGESSACGQDGGNCGCGGACEVKTCGCGK